MTSDASPILPRIAVLAAAIIAAIAFLYMVKLMYDISGNVGRMAGEMASMSADMGQMRLDMSSLARDVSAMGGHTATLPAIAEDMQRMRIGMDRLSGIVGGADQLPGVNPLGVIQQMIPSGERR
jgi:hypothetical protein